MERTLNETTIKAIIAETLRNILNEESISNQFPSFYILYWDDDYTVKRIEPYCVLSEENFERDEDGEIIAINLPGEDDVNYFNDCSNTEGEPEVGDLVFDCGFGYVFYRPNNGITGHEDPMGGGLSIGTKKDLIDFIKENPDLFEYADLNPKKFIAKLLTPIV